MLQELLTIGKVFRVIVLVTAGFIASGAPNALAQGALREYQIKAAFLYNFTKFVEWPAEAFTDSGAPMIVGILGDDPFGVALESIQDKTVKGRKLEIKRFESIQGVEFCHILFISSSKKERLAQILEALKNSSVLTVGERDGFTQLGGMVNFTIKKNKIRFEINPDAAEQARLKLNSKLLRLGKVVKNRRQGEDN